MPFPVGVVTRNFQTVPVLGAGGEPVSGKLAIVPSTSLKWAADGTVILKSVEIFPFVGGVASGVLPIVQPGFVDNFGSAIDSFTYMAIVQESEYGVNIPAYVFELLTGPGTYILDFAIPEDVTGTTVTEFVPVPGPMRDDIITSPDMTVVTIKAMTQLEFDTSTPGPNQLTLIINP